MKNLYVGEIGNHHSWYTELCLGICLNFFLQIQDTKEIKFGKFMSRTSV